MAEIDRELGTREGLGWLGGRAGTSFVSVVSDRLSARIAIIAIAYAACLALALFVQLPKGYAVSLSVFFGSLAGLVAACHATPLGPAAASVLDRFARFLERRGSFRSNAEIEAPKFALVRIVFGALMVHRAFLIFLYLLPDDWNEPLLVVLVGCNLVAAVMVTIGLFTQAAFAFLILVQWQISDAVMGTSTLGNDVAAMLSLLLMFANAGAHLSLDARLRTSPGFVGRAVRASYAEHGVPADSVLQIAKFLALYSYWCVCLYSLMMHLNEPAWMNGSAGPYLLSNSFMSRYASEISTLLSLSPWIVLLARSALWAMLPWYALIIPFILLGKTFRLYIIVWAILFFALSLFVLQLGWLAHFEFLFLAALFWQRRLMERPRSFEVAYDDRCNLCDRTINVVKFVDVFRRVQLRPLSTSGEWLASHGIEPAAASQDLYGVDAKRGNSVHGGYDFYIALTANVFLLSVFWPILIVGKWLRIGPIVYRWVADRRTRLFGVCELPTSKREHEVMPSDAVIAQGLRGGNPIVPVALHVGVLSIGYFLATPAPFLGWQALAHVGSVRATAGAAHIYGIAPIDVFNAKDLRMAENWFTLTAVYKDNRSQLLPLFSEEGKRLGMHVSDRVYYGFSIRYRRDVIDRKGCFFRRHRKMIERLAGGYASKDVDSFVYTQYYQPLYATDRVLAGEFRQEQSSIACSIVFRLAANSPPPR